MTDKEGDARFSLPVVHLSFLRSFIVRLYGGVIRTHSWLCVHMYTSKTQKQRYNVSSLEHSFLFVCLCVSACIGVRVCTRKGTRIIIKRRKRNLWKRSCKRYMYDNDLIVTQHKLMHIYTYMCTHIRKSCIAKINFKYKTTFVYSWKHAHSYTI